MYGLFIQKSLNNSTACFSHSYASFRFAAIFLRFSSTDKSADYIKFLHYLYLTCLTKIYEESIKARVTKSPLSPWLRYNKHLLPLNYNAYLTKLLV